MKKALLIIYLTLFLPINFIFSQILCIQCNNQNLPLNPTASNAISNGSFEFATCPITSGIYVCPNSFAYSNCDATDWTCIDGGSSTYAQFFNNSQSEIADGAYAMYLGNYFCKICSPLENDYSCLVYDGCEVSGIPFGYPNNTFEYGGLSGVSITQTVNNLIIGNIYCLEFWTGGENGFMDDGVFGVDLGFGYNFLTCIPTPGGSVGRRYLITFRATNTSHTVKFTNWGHISNTSTEVILDDIKLYPVAEAVTTTPNCVFFTNNIQNVCISNSYTYNGTTYNFPETGGIDTLISISGLDSIITTIINWQFIYEIPNIKNICSGNSYTFNGNIYTQTGMYKDTLQSIFGCDSIIITDLTVGNAATTNNPQTICQGASYTINGHTYLQPGTYNDTLSAQAGCDSIIITELTFANNIKVNNPQAICQGFTYTINGHSYSLSGSYVDTLSAVAGCDSIITTILTLQDCTQCRIVMPNAFSPNQDGVNDVLKPIGMCVESLNTQIFNRWGQKVFSTSSMSDGWDGTYKNIAQGVGVYVYTIQGKYDTGVSFKLKGNVMLVR